MRVHHLNCATLRPLGGRLVNASGTRLTGRMVCHCLLVETGEGLVLVDTGIGLGDAMHPLGTLPRAFSLIARPVFDPAEAAVRQVRALGHDPADVRHIVLTHLDLDHAGALPDFPNARVHVSAAELDAATHPRDTGERLRYRAAQWAHGPRWVTYGPGGDDWFGFGGVRAAEGLPDILLVPLAGHTRGHQGVAVRDDGGRWLLHAGDAYFHHGLFDPAGPRSTPLLGFFERRVQTDRDARLENRARLRELSARSMEVSVFSAHDPVELKRFEVNRLRA